MRKIRTLIVDDAVVMRRLLSEVIAADPELEVAGTAPNGRIALSKISQISPDVITLDIEMPELDGLATLAAIRKQYPSLPVVMLSRHLQRGNVNTLDAISLGASDYLSLPVRSEGFDESVAFLRGELLPKLKRHALRSTADDSGTVSVSPPAGLNPHGHPTGALLIGCSTGGPNALATLMPDLAGLTVPIFIVQHMPPMFTRMMAERLTTQTGIPMAEATDGGTVPPGHVVIAPGDTHLSLTLDATGAVRTVLGKEPPVNSCRPSVDVLFESAAGIYGDRCLAVVLTGMGKDGLRGCETLRAAGARILAQDEATSVVWGMPGYVARAGLADEIVPLPLMARAIRKRLPGERSAVR